LARAGYDVWLGNQRGTKYSMGHKSLNPKKDKAYWEFSFTEMGDYDAPAQVDYVRSATGIDKVTYIGHSQGTSQMFYGIQDRQDFWKERINLFTALAPVTRLHNAKCALFQFLAAHYQLLENVTNFLGVYDILGHDSLILSSAFCGLIPEFCRFAEGFLITQDPSLDDLKRF